MKLCWGGAWEGNGEVWGVVQGWGMGSDSDSEEQSPGCESSSELLAESSCLLTKPLETISVFCVNDLR